MTSENPIYPVENALLLGKETGWRALNFGEQRLRLVFDEHERPRTQEFLLLWSPGGLSPTHEIVRQQFNFSPPTTTREVENYTVNLGGASTLELRIKLHLSGGEGIALLTRLRLM